MASQADIIKFLTDFLPVLAELGVRVEMLERAVFEGGIQPAAGAQQASAEEGDEDEIDLGPIGKISLSDMLKNAGGDPKALFEKAAKWKAAQQQQQQQPTSTPTSTAAADAANGKAT